MEIIGHIIGFIAFALFFLSYQMKEKGGLLIVQTLATTLSCIQYLLIGAYSGFALNIVCITRNVAFCFFDRKQRLIKLLSIAFSAVLGIVSFFSWDGYHSILIIAGLIVNTICLGICNAQNLRKSILITCPMVCAYNVLSFSISGICSETLSFISALIGILRFREEKTK